MLEIFFNPGGNIQIRREENDREEIFVSFHEPYPIPAEQRKYSLIHGL